MAWTPALITQLRRRLGWTRAELSRRVGVTVTVIEAWEKGGEAPGQEICNQLDFLEGHLNRYCECLSKDPVAEIFLKENGLNQVSRTDLEN
jgi:DNA-binding XRE family transcriptional regulator